jgi:putative Holliday junction resolvase
MRVMGVDPGTNRTGVALSDEAGWLATPKLTLALREPQALAMALAALIETEGVQEVVVGLALNMDGSEGPAARRGQALAALIAGLSPARVILWDERLTTVQAQRSERQRGQREQAARATRDQRAAAFLLQSYLDSRPSDIARSGA